MYNVQFTGPYQGHVWTILGPCLHIFSFQLAKILKSFETESTLYKGYISSIQIGTISRPYLDHVMPIFGLDLHEVSIFGTIPGGCFHHIESIFSVALFQSSIDL